LIEVEGVAAGIGSVEFTDEYHPEGQEGPVLFAQMKLFG
jgi:hypothetical protein